MKGVNIQITLQVQMSKYISTSEIEAELMGEEIQHQTINKKVNFLAKNYQITNPNDIKSILQESYNNIIQKIDKYQNEGSQWSLTKIYNSYVNLAIYDPMRHAASSYIPLPDNIQAKQATINIKNDDKLCFIWSVLAHLEPADNKNPNRVSNYSKFMKDSYPDKKYINMFSEYTYPMSIRDIKKFEKNNNISINVYQLIGDSKNSKVAPLQITKLKNTITHIDLLYVQQADDFDELMTDGANSHYVLIKDFDRLNNIAGKTTKSCKYCLKRFYECSTTKDKLKLEYPEENDTRRNDEKAKKAIWWKLHKHIQDKICQDHEAILTKFPIKGDNKLEFKPKNFIHQQRKPFITYADFESYFQEVENEDETETQEENSYTKKKFKHIPCGYAFHTVCSYNPKLNKTVLVRGDGSFDVAQKFIRDILDEKDRVHRELETNIPMLPLTKIEEEKYENATHCYICEGLLNEPSPYNLKEISVKVRDHDHLTGQFRAAAHSNCNLQYNITRKIDKNGEIKEQKYQLPVVFHNFKGYDGHFIVSAIQEDIKINSISCIANSKEKLMTLSFANIKFIDSFQFLATSLDELSGNLPKKTQEEKESSFNNIFTQFKNYSPEQINLLLQKGEYPYEYFTAKSDEKWCNKFDETQLPPIEEFYSSLRGSSISNKKYEHAQNVWNKFNMKSLGDYHDLYLMTDVLLLADVFENFRDTMLKYYKLDPSWYISLPAFSLDACLKFSKVKVELLTSGLGDIYHTMEKNIRGGMSGQFHRYAKANNKRMKNYNPKLPNIDIIALDANNLYGWAMSQKLPIGDFKYDSINKYTTEYILNMNDNSDYGAILTVDLHCPSHLHDKFKEYPIMPRKSSSIY